LFGESEIHISGLESSEEQDLLEVETFFDIINVF